MLDELVAAVTVLPARSAVGLSGFAGAGNKLTRSTGAITALDHIGTRLRAWELIDVFPVRWKGPEFAVESASPLEEELEITHHGFRAKTQA